MELQLLPPPVFKPRQHHLITKPSVFKPRQPHLITKPVGFYHDASINVGQHLKAPHKLMVAANHYIICKVIQTGFKDYSYYPVISKYKPTLLPGDKCWFIDKYFKTTITKKNH